MFGFLSMMTLPVLKTFWLNDIGARLRILTSTGYFINFSSRFSSFSSKSSGLFKSMAVMIPISISEKCRSDIKDPNSKPNLIGRFYSTAITIPEAGTPVELHWETYSDYEVQLENSANNEINIGSMQKPGRSMCSGRTKLPTCGVRFD